MSRWIMKHLKRIKNADSFTLSEYNSPKVL